MGACVTVKMFVVAICLGGIIEVGIQVFNSNYVFHTKNHIRTH